MTIQRFNHYSGVYYCYGGEMETDSDCGDYVLYEDHLKIVESLENLILELQERE